MSEMYQGKMIIERGDQKCVKCHSRLSFPCIEFKGDKFYIKCTDCGEEFVGQREADRKMFHKLMETWNGKM